MAYRFIQKYSYLFGVRCLLRRLNIYPNAYYNYVKNRKKESIQEKENIKNKIKEIYYSNFTYLKLTDGTFRYNCSILDLYDRSIVARCNS